MSAQLQRPFLSVSSLFGPGSRADNLARLVGLRWIAIVGQLSAVIAAGSLVGIALPLAPMLAVIGALAAFNLFTQRFAQPMRRAARGSDERLLFVELLVDVAALTLLLYWSGGADNPFVSLFLLQLSIGAALLPAWRVGVLLLISVAAFAGLNVFKVPLAWPGGEPVHELQLLGSGVAFLLSAGLIALFVTRMTASLRERDRMLALEREAKLRDQQLVAIGTMATGALHELGTPLSTIKVLVGELLDVPAGARAEPQAEADLRLIAAQVDACKRTLSQLAARSGAARAEGARAQSLGAWLDETVARWRVMQPRTEIGWEPGPQLDALQVAVDEMLSQALLNLLNNAAQASPARVDASARIDGDALEVRVRDYGPGIPAAIAAHAGRAIRSTREDGMGLGLFLAHAVVERFGGCIALENHPEGGLVARMRVPLAHWRV